MISAFVMVMSGVWMAIGRPSTPAFVASVASRAKASMNSGRQSGYQQ